MGVRELRASLATVLNRVTSGVTVVINRGGRPVARLVPVDDHSRVEHGLEEMARLGLVERPRVLGDPPPDGVLPPGRALPIDVRVDRIVRQVRG